MTPLKALILNGRLPKPISSGVSAQEMMDQIGNLLISIKSVTSSNSDDNEIQRQGKFSFLTYKNIAFPTTPQGCYFRRNSVRCTERLKEPLTAFINKNFNYYVPSCLVLVSRDQKNEIFCETLLRSFFVITFFSSKNLKKVRRA